METKTLSIVAKARDEASAELKKVQREVDKTAETVKKSTSKFDGFTKSLGDNGKKMSDVGGKMATRITLPLLAAAGASTKMSQDFNASMANIATLIPGSTERVNELKVSIQDMAIQTGKSTADLSDGMYNVISAFGDTADSVKILELNAKAAKAGLAETTDAINLTSGVTKGYGDTSAEAVQKASDLALMTVRLGQTTFPELAASMGRVTPIAASLNISQEELFGTMATFTGVTGKAAEVSTQMKGVMQSLMAPTADMQALYKDLGVESGEAMIKQFGLQGSIEKIVDSAAASGQPLQKFISSIDGQTIALAATGGQADNFTDKIAAMGDVAGTTDIAFKEVTEGVNKAGFEMEQAKAKAEVAGQKMGDALAPAITKVSDAVSKVADWFIKLNPQQQKTVLIIGGIVAAIAPLLIMFGKMAQGMAAVMKASKFMWKHFGKAMSKGIATAAKTAASWVASGVKMVASAIASAASHVAAAASAAAAWVVANAAMLLGIGIIIAAVVGLVVVVVKNWDTIKKYALIAWEKIKQAASAVFKAIGTVVKFYINIYISVFKFMFGAVKKVFNAVKAAAVFVFRSIKAAVTFYINVYIAIFNRIKAAVTAVWNAIGKAAKWVFNSVISPAINFIVGRFNNMKDNIIGAFNTVKGFAQTVFNGVKDTISGAFSGISSVITAPFKTAFNGIASLWNSSIGKLSFKAPDWVPGLGGKGFSMPTLPMLATGGVVERATAAIIGEGSEPEAVLPLSKLDGMLENARGEAVPQQSTAPNITIEIHGNVIGDESNLRKLAIDIGKQLEHSMKAQGTRDVNRLRTI